MNKNTKYGIIIIFLIVCIFYGYQIFNWNHYGYFTVGYTRGALTSSYGKISVRVSYNDLNNEICFGEYYLGRAKRNRNFNFENACYLICVYGDEIYLFTNYPLDCSITQEEIDSLVKKENIKVPYSEIFTL